MGRVIHLEESHRQIPSTAFTYDGLRMRSPSWEDMHNQLSSAGLIVQTSAVEKLEKLQNVLPLIEAANSSGVRLLNGATVDELLAISS